MITALSAQLDLKKNCAAFNQTLHTCDKSDCILCLLYTSDAADE